MRRLHFALGALLLVGALAVVAASAGAKTESFGARANGSTVNLRRGDTLRVMLTEVKDGGFVWRTLARPAPSVLTRLASIYIAPQLAPGTTGGEGTRVERYHARAAGKTHVRLGLFGPSSMTNAVQRFRLTVVVR
jgi:predicted secreted protein